MARQGDLRSDVLDVDTWCNPNDLQVASFRSSKKLPCGAP